MPEAAILYDGRPTHSSPRKRMEPRVVAGRICMIALQSVVLPMPLRPMMATGSSPIVKLTPCSTCAGP